MEKKQCRLKNNLIDKKHFIRHYQRNSSMALGNLWAIVGNQHINKDATIPLVMEGLGRLAEYGNTPLTCNGWYSGMVGLLLAY